MSSVFFSRITPVANADVTHSEAAAARVLEAERAALARIEQSKVEALRLVDESRTQAELISRRAEIRIRRLRERMTAAAKLREQRINSEMAVLASDKGTDASALVAMDAAIARMVDELAGNLESH